MSHLPSTSISNRSRVHPTNLNYFQGSPYRQYGSGIGAAIKAGLRGFVIPMVKRYGIPVAKSFLQQAAPEVLNILDGSAKPKTAMKNAVKKTIRQQIGGGRGRTKKKKVAAKEAIFQEKKQIQKKNRKSVASRSKKTFKKKRSPKSVAPSRQRLKKKAKREVVKSFLHRLLITPNCFQKKLISGPIFSFSINLFFIFIVTFVYYQLCLSNQMPDTFI